MYTIEQIVCGLSKFVDNEILPKMDTKSKIIVGTVISIAFKKYKVIDQKIKENEMAKTIGVVDENGQYDVDTIADTLKENAEKFGKVQINIPVAGTMTFSADDIEKLKQYIES